MRLSKFKSCFLILSLLGFGAIAGCKSAKTTVAQLKDSERNRIGVLPTGDEPGFHIVGPPLQAFGPLDPYHGFPMWYQDANGVRLDLCHDGDAKCVPPAAPFNPLLPPRFPENFPSEAFYWLAESTLPISTGGNLSVIFALEAAFMLEDPMPGQHITFGRTRFTGKGLKNGTYRITHPYGVDQFDVTAGTIKSVRDIGVATESFAGVLNSPFGTYLSWDIGAPAGYIGDAGVPHAFVGSPYGTNFYRVEYLEGGAATVVSETNQATISGRIAKDIVSVAPLSKSLNSAPTVRMVASTPGNNIFYTTDGTDPTASSARYTDPVALTSLDPLGKIILKVASENVGIMGPVSTYEYALNPTLITVSAVPEGGTYSTPISVTLNKEGPATAIWYTLDGQDPLVSATKMTYQGPISLPNNGLTKIRYAAVGLDASGVNVVSNSDVSTAYYSIATQRLTRSEYNPAVDLPFSISDNAGVSLSPCWDPNDPMCLGATPNVNLARPIIFPRNFSQETFFFNATAVLRGAQTGKALLVMAVEGAYGLPETISPGERLLFSRIRIRVDADTAGHYRVTHPYGVNHFDVAVPGVRAINLTEDIALSPGNLDAFRFGRVGPFLKWDAGAPAGYIGDPTIAHTVTGSPYNTNFFAVEKQVNGVYQPYLFTDQFNVAGKIAPALGVSASPMGALYGSPRDVVLSSSDANASIFYTTDGSDPTTSSTVLPYQSALLISSTTWLRFYAKLPDGTTSAVTSEPYNIELTPPVVTPDHVGGAYIDGVTVTLSGSRFGVIYFTTDGSSPLVSPTRKVYAAPIVLKGPLPIQLKSAMVDEANTASVERTDLYNFTQKTPVVTSPVAKFVLNGRLTGARVPMNITWTGSAFGGRTVASYTLQLSQGGRAFTSVTLPLTTPPTTSITPLLQSGSSYLYAVSMKDSGANVSPIVRGTLFNLSLAQENARGIRLGAGWTRIASTAFSGGAAVSATRAGSTASLPIAGSQIAWITSRGPTMGIATVSVDGGAPVVVDLYSPTTLPSSLAFTTPPLATGRHTITVTVAGTKNPASRGTRVDVDAFVAM